MSSEDIEPTEMIVKPRRKPRSGVLPVRQPVHFLCRVGDGNHFKSSSTSNIWGIISTSPVGKGFLSTAKEGDILWFVKTKSKGLLLAVATFTRFQPRVLGPILTLTQTNEELGWTETEGNWDMEVHYKDLYNITLCGLLSGIKGNASLRQYKSDKCDVNLPEEYKNIVRYAHITTTM